MRTTRCAREHIEGQTIVLDRRFAKGKTEELPSLAAKWCERSPQVPQPLLARFTVSRSVRTIVRGASVVQLRQRDPAPMASCPTPAS